ncbi:MAG: anhydro-N-acetylmuramic acid kinase, partial [Planctomycetia bacterium]
MIHEPSVWNSEPPRLFAGVGVGRRSQRLKAALVHGHGEGLGFRVRSAEALTAPLPEGLLEGRLDADGRRPIDALAAAFASTLHDLAGRAGAAVDAIECVGVDTSDALAGFPAARLAAGVAELTGLTVAAGFGDADQAAGGAGAPLSPLPDWLLFRSPRLSRLLVHLGSTLQLTLLRPGAPPSAMLAYDVGPCCEFLDGLARDLSQGRYPYDPGGQFAVQGRLSEPLLAQWKSHPFLLRKPPRTLDPVEFGEPFRQASLAFAREQKLTADDVLCTANHFVVRNLRDAVQRLPG